MSHLRAGIAIDHSGSFLVIGTLVVTQPLYRARVRVWAAGINLTFWNWSGHGDIRVFASQIRTGCGRSPRIHGDDGGDFVELAVPRSPALDGAGNGTSAYLLRKSAPAAVDLLGFTETMGETLLNWPSQGLPRSMERATGRPRICFANPHRLRSPIGALACSL